MKILHIINNLGSGGAEKLLEQTLPRINKIDGIEIDLLLLTDSDNIYEAELKKKNIKINIVPLRKPRNPLNILYIRGFIKKGRYDIVHTHLFPSQYWTVLAVELISKKPKLVTTEHSTFNRRREKIYFRLLDSFIYSKYKKVISISDKAQVNLTEWIITKENEHSKFEVIENGIDLSKYTNAVPYNKSEFNPKLTDDNILIGMIGRFSHEKDQKTLIKAVNLLSSNIYLVLVGEGPLQEESLSLATELHISERVHFLGYRNDVAKILKSIDLLVLSSNWEGFGLAAVEGMAAGKLVLGSNVDGLREVIGDKDLLFEVGDFKKLSEKIEFFLKNEEITQKKVESLMTKSTQFSLGEMVDRYVSMYRELINLHER
ncbi:glycosyltransferase [Paenibacillus tepidiphilus]|uniref:glycosyltransferase n=1 Tax=Paenibacillus tepidiphilus TaxID=2608683 RepID=UPI0013A5B46D|nr:glycosyltransferase [Paenibacillus tepidiphilus]